MVNKDDVQELANLSRIEITENEAQELSKEIEDILGYVGQVSQIAFSHKTDDIVFGSTRNVWREDDAVTQSGEYSKELIEAFPEKEGDLLKVKKVL